MKILLVDDEPDFLEQAEALLEEEDDRLKIDSTTSAKEGLQKFSEKNYDAIVSNYQMPEMDALDFLETIRKEKENDITFILFTGRGREEVAMKALNLGADRYLRKEGDPKSKFESLAQAIIEETKSKSTEQELERKKKSGEKVYESLQEPKGAQNFSESKSDIMKNLLRGDMNPIRLADKLEIGETAVREHLKVLEDLGYVESYFKRANRGRPKKMYRLTMKGRETFPSQRKLFLKNLVQSMREKLGEKGFQNILSTALSNVARSSSDFSLPKSRVQIGDIGEFLENFNFSFSITKSEAFYYLEFYCCAFPQTAKEIREHPCRRLLSEAFTETDSRMEKCRVEGDDRCILRIDLESNET